MKSKYLEDTKASSQPRNNNANGSQNGDATASVVVGGSGIAKQMQMALMQDAESRQKNIKKTEIDFPLDAIGKGGQIKAKANFEKGPNGRNSLGEEAEEEENGGERSPGEVASRYNRSVFERTRNQR